MGEESVLHVSEQPESDYLISRRRELIGLIFRDADGHVTTIEPGDLATDSILCPEDVWKRQRWMYKLLKEHFVLLCLDVRKNVIHEETVAVGSLTNCYVHPREVFRPAVMHNAHSCILIHNHPSGDPTASDEDIALTRRMDSAGEILGIKLLDHVVVSRWGFQSIREVREI